MNLENAIRYQRLMDIIPGLSISSTKPEVEVLTNRYRNRTLTGSYKDTVREKYAGVTVSTKTGSYTSSYYGPVEYWFDTYRNPSKPVKKRSELNEDLLVSFIWCWMLDARILDDEGIKDATDLALCEWLVGEKPTAQDVRKMYIALREAEDAWKRCGMSRYEPQLQDIYEDY